jgi:hypothetical protein
MSLIILLVFKLETDLRPSSSSSAAINCIFCSMCSLYSIFVLRLLLLCALKTRSENGRSGKGRALADAIWMNEKRDYFPLASLLLFPTVCAVVDELADPWSHHLRPGWTLGRSSGQ